MKHLSMFTGTPQADSYAGYDQVYDGLKKSAVGKHSASNPLHLPNIEELIEVGQIKVGVIPKLRCIAATADDRHNNLAMLVRREGETLAELLTRLDLAITKARTEDIFTDEINPPHS